MEQLTNRFDWFEMKFVVWINSGIDFCVWFDFIYFVGFGDESVTDWTKEESIGEIETSLNDSTSLNLFKSFWIRFFPSWILTTQTSQLHFDSQTGQIQLIFNASTNFEPYLFHKQDSQKCLGQEIFEHSLISNILFLSLHWWQKWSTSYWTVNRIHFKITFW